MGQGSGTTTPTIRATVNTTTVTLTQLYGGSAGNTTITYGAKIINTFGTPQTFDTFSGGSTAGAGPQNGKTTNLSGLTVNVTIDGGASISNVVLNTSTAASQAAIGSTILITNVSNATGNT